MEYVLMKGSDKSYPIITRLQAIILQITEWKQITALPSLLSNVHFHSTQNENVNMEYLREQENAVFILLCDRLIIGWYHFASLPVAANIYGQEVFRRSANWMLTIWRSQLRRLKEIGPAQLCLLCLREITFSYYFVLIYIFLVYFKAVTQKYVCK